jgi:alpha-beta hydrolase superfamily lysophospholipase
MNASQATGVQSASSSMRSSDFRLAVDDGVELFVRRWEPEAAPKAVVQIAHGMTEHSGRYARLAEQLVAAGYAVYAADHRGHGSTAVAPGDLGYFGDTAGWLRAVDDLYAVRRRIGQEHPDLPVFAFGHSMGSMMMQQYLFSHGDSIAGAVLSGVGGGRSLLALGGSVMALAERIRLGPRGRSWLLQKASFGSYNNEFAPARTEFDWLSRDPAEVDSYIADPLCGFALTVQGWLDVLRGTLQIERAENMRRIPAALPVYVFSGARDPVGRNGAGVRWLIDAYRRAGLRDVTLRLYPEGRHEMLNETNRDEVTRDLISWLDSAFAGSQRGGTRRPAPAG